jgi:hypothetical protein
MTPSNAKPEASTRCEHNRLANACPYCGTMPEAPTPPAPVVVPERCTMSQDSEDSDCWETTCGAAWYFEEPPDADDHKFCAHCGKHLKIELWKDDEETGEP